MFNLTKFLTENKLTRNSLLLESDNAPSFTNKEMKFFNPKEVKWGRNTDGNIVATYKGHIYKLEHADQNVEDSDGEGNGFGEVWLYNSKLPGVYFQFDVEGAELQLNDLSFDIGWDDEKEEFLRSFEININTKSFKPVIDFIEKEFIRRYDNNKI